MKCLISSLVAAIFFLSLSGCVSKPLLTEKIQDLEFTVLAEEEIPKELRKEIEDGKQKAFRIAYEDEGFLYIAEGYGAQSHTGYSVKVAEVYETQNAVYFHSVLLGPDKGEKTEDKTTFPYVVIKLNDIGKEVLFD